MALAETIIYSKLGAVFGAVVLTPIIGPVAGSMVGAKIGALVGSGGNPLSLVGGDVLDVSIGGGIDNLGGVDVPKPPKFG